MTNGCKTWDSSNFSCLTIFNGWKWCVCIPAAIVRFFFFSFFSISWGKKWSSIFSRAIYYAHLGDEANELLHDDRIEFEIHRSQCIKLSFLTLSVSEYLKRQIPSELWNYILYVFFQEISFVYYSIFASMWKHCDCELKLCKHETKLEKGETRINSNAL